jgi:serine/threonine protein phosphatase PrpC
MKVAIHGLTDLGQLRPTNEDCHGWWVPKGDDELRRRGILLAVADGMGGANAGEEASRLTIDTLIATYSSGPGIDPGAELIHAVEQANHTVYQAAQDREDWRGMGTTCTAVVILDQDLLVAQVGDSRAYLIAGKNIHQLTRDHSLVGELVELGRITAEEARVHPNRNVMTRVVGVGAQVEVEGGIWQGVFGPDTTLVLCTDGLHGVLEDDEIKALACNTNLKAGTEDLVRAANQRGGPDNITVILSRPGIGQMADGGACASAS